MAEVIVMPKLGNTVESAIILAWRVELGAPVRVGDVLCEIETDKATLEVEATAAGLLLARLYREGEEAPILSEIAVVGEEGESVAEFSPRARSAAQGQGCPAAKAEAVATRQERQASDDPPGKVDDSAVKISPRAQHLARRKGIDAANLSGSGPEGRIIERDIEAAIRARVSVTPVAQAMLDSGEFKLARKPSAGRVGKLDLALADDRGDVTEIPLKGLRKTIARRLLESSQKTAQLTLNASSDASALQAFRRRLKESEASLGLRAVSINDLLMFAVARTLPSFPGLNARFENDIIYQQASVHLGMAVDTERGLLVPVIRSAEALSLRQLSAEARRLAGACRAGDIQPDELSGGSFTLSNLGALGVESFTPLLNPPQVAILGVGGISLKPVQAGDGVEFRPHIGLSLTIDHQIVDGAPAGRFLAQLGANLAQIDLLAICM
ncbi:MAG: dihydrolipoamide acetyltransferase family protein [Chloroflexota bacterium]|nr:dihydrolipoamide acetyltransferase family protein [Chloroflexota bacterium]